MTKIEQSTLQAEASFLTLEDPVHCCYSLYTLSYRYSPIQPKNWWVWSGTVSLTESEKRRLLHTVTTLSQMWIVHRIKKCKVLKTGFTALAWYIQLIVAKFGSRNSFKSAAFSFKWVQLRASRILYLVSSESSIICGCWKRWPRSYCAAWKALE